MTGHASTQPFRAYILSHYSRFNCSKQAFASPSRTFTLQVELWTFEHNCVFRLFLYRFAEPKVKQNGGGCYEIYCDLRNTILGGATLHGMSEVGNTLRLVEVSFYAIANTQRDQLRRPRN